MTGHFAIEYMDGERVQIDICRWKFIKDFLDKIEFNKRIKLEICTYFKINRKI